MSFTRTCGRSTIHQHAVPRNGECIDCPCQRIQNWRYKGQQLCVPAGSEQVHMQQKIHLARLNTDLQLKRPFCKGPLRAMAEGICQHAETTREVSDEEANFVILTSYLNFPHPHTKERRSISPIGTAGKRPLWSC